MRSFPIKIKIVSGLNYCRYDLVAVQFFVILVDTIQKIVYS